MRASQQLLRRGVLNAVVVSIAVMSAAFNPVLVSTGEATERPELKLGRSPTYDYDPPVPGSYELPVIGPAGDGRVLGSDGKSRQLRQLLKDRISILSFIYTRCADPTACPMSSGVLFEIHQISKKDPTIADNLQLVTFSFDPEHDTPQVMENYGRALRGVENPGSDWMFLTTKNTDELKPILDAYRQRVDRKKDPRDPLGPFFHLVRVYLIDRDTNIRNIYSFGLLDPRMLLTDVRTLLLEEAEAKK